MTIVLPLANDKLGDKGHSHMHRVYAIDSDAPSSSIIVDDIGSVFVSGTLTSFGTANVGGNLNVTSALTAGSIQNTPIGSTTKNTGAFTTLTTSGVASFTSNVASTSTTTGSVVVTGGLGVSGDIYSNNIYGNSIQNTPIGSVTKNTGAFTNLTATGTTLLANTTSIGTVSSTWGQLVWYVRLWFPVFALGPLRLDHGLERWLSFPQ